MALAKILKYANFAILEADSVASAIAHLENITPNWVLLDLLLPDGDGSLVNDFIVKNNINTQICLLTGCSTAVVNALEKHVKHVFRKPIDLSQLLLALDVQS